MLQIQIDVKASSLKPMLDLSIKNANTTDYGQLTTDTSRVFTFLKALALAGYPDFSYLFSSEKPGPLGHIRDIWLCLGVLCLKSQIPSTKSQINFKFQYSIVRPRGSRQVTKTFQPETLFGFLNFGYCYLFDI